MCMRRASGRAICIGDLDGKTGFSCSSDRMAEGMVGSQRIVAAIASGRHDQAEGLG